MELFKNSITKTGQNLATTSMSGVKVITIDAPAQYGGSSDTLNPEELFVASINSCIMLVFYHFARKYNVTVLSYHSQAEGVVEKTKNGLRFTKVTVNAAVQIDTTHAEKLVELSQLAEKHCLVSNSVSCPVVYTVGLMTETVS